VVNHLPIVGTIIGTLVLISGFLLKKEQVKLTALGIYIFSAITGIISNATGEGAEEIIEHIQGISESRIHIHEEMAETFLSIIIALGILSVVTFFLSIKKSKYRVYGFFFVLLVAIAASISGKYVGTSEGEIRHTEIRTDINSALNPKSLDASTNHEND
jgi:uncharacterized membrane protein